jgi:Trk K+ transport system NAD-binding subunit
LLIAEAAAHGTLLPGQTIGESGLRGRTGVSVIGVWEHGRLEIVDRNTMIRPDTVFVLAGTREQLDLYNAAFSAVMEQDPQVIIVGGGRVGRVTSRELQELGVRPTIIEKIPERVAEHPEAVIGDATQIEVLKNAGVRDATTLVITTHDDETNIAFTIFFRRLRSDWQILARCTHDRSVKTLGRAGADLVLSYASMGANTVFNLLRSGDSVLLAEGLSVFPEAIPPSVAGRSLEELRIRSLTGCTVITVEADGERNMNPGRDFVMPDKGRMLLGGTLEAEDRFLETFRPARVPAGKRG